MIAVELVFTPTAERLSNRPAHRDVLQGLHDAGVVVAAGPWADDAGALLIFDADRSTVDAILTDDPYYTTPGVEVTSVRDWIPIVGPRNPETH